MSPTSPAPIFHDDLARELELGAEPNALDCVECEGPLGYYLGKRYDNPDIDQEFFVPFYEVPDGRLFCEDCFEEVTAESPEIDLMPDPCEACDGIGVHGPECHLDPNPWTELLGDARQLPVRFLITKTEHPNCRACLREVHPAAVYTRLTGSVGAKHSTVAVDGSTHSASVERCF